LLIFSLGLVWTKFPNFDFSKLIDLTLAHQFSSFICRILNHKNKKIIVKMCGKKWPQREFD